MKELGPGNGLDGLLVSRASPGPVSYLRALKLKPLCEGFIFEVFVWACFGRFWAPKGLPEGRGSVQQNFGKRWALGVAIKVIL